MGDIKEKIQQRRCELNLSLSEVAKRTGVSKATIHRWETGETTGIKSDKLVALAAALEVTPEYLIGLDDKEEDKYSEKLDQVVASLTPEEQAYVLRFAEDLKQTRKVEEM